MALNLWQFIRGLRIKPSTTSTIDSKGEMEVDDTSGKLQYHNGTTISPVVTESHTATLTNKTLSGASNTINNVPAANIVNTPSGNLAAADVQAALNELQTDVDTRTTTATFTAHTGASTGVHGVAGAVVGTTDVQTLTNKTLSDSTTSIVDAVDATKKLVFDVQGNAGTTTTLTASVSANRTITLPDISDTLVSNTNTATLTNKSISGATNTLSNIPNAATTATSANTVDAIVARDGTGSFAANTVTAQTLSSTGTLLISPASNVNVTPATTFSVVTPANNNITLTPGGTGIVDIDNISLSDNTITTQAGGLVVSSVAGSATTVKTENSGTAGAVTVLAGNSTTANIDGAAVSVTAGNATAGNANGGGVTLAAGTGFGTGHTGDITLSGRSLQLPTGASDPSGGLAEGMVYWNTGTNKIKSYTGTAWSELSGGGGGGINFLGLDTAANKWATVSTDDRDFEVSIGNWVAYADAAGTSPVDMTGGAPSTTMTQVTTSQLNGTGSAKMDLGAAASRQGEGVSCLVNIPTGYRGQNVAFTGQFSITGAIVEDDLKLYAYDVTAANAELITPFSYSKILGSTGKFYCIFPTKTNTEQIRVGIHVARTSTAALSVILDDLSVSPSIPAVGMAGSDWTSFTPTGSWVANTTYSGKWRRVGDSIEIQYGVTTSGAPTATSLSLNFPSGVVLDTSKMEFSANTTAIIGLGMVRDAGSNSYPAFGYYLSTSAVQVRVQGQSTTYIDVGSAVTETVPITFGATDAISLTVKFPVVGCSSNVSLGESSVFKISSYLANGTRVTATPTKLGEYRSQYRAANNTNVLTDVAPTATPSTANGMLIYGSQYSLAGTSGQISHWEIFIGKNKHWSLEAYSSAGRTGNSNIAFMSPAGATMYGTNISYDPTTGVVTLDAAKEPSGINTARYVGYSDAGASAGSSYFDIIVSENPLFVSAGANVACKYQNTAGTAVTNPRATIPFATKLYDTHSAYNTSTGVFTAPIGGKYRITAQLYTAAVTNSTSQYLEISCKATSGPEGLSGAVHELDLRWGEGVLHARMINGSRTYLLNAGDTLEIQGFNSVATTLLTNAGVNILCIERVDNYS